MSRLVVVSNRVADFEMAAQSGGLAVAVSDALRTRGGVWFGWDGKVVSAGTRVPANIQTYDNVTTITLPLTRKDYDEFYVGFSNSVLWPIFHYRLDLAAHKASFLTGYKRVNSKFADALGKLLRPDDIIWIHDYHLIPLASELRRRGHRQTIGFFLHIPFPSNETFSATPGYHWLSESMMDYDLIGFQTTTDVENFVYAVTNERDDIAFDGETLVLGKRKTRVGRFPIGIDVDAFRSIARSQSADEQISFLQRRTVARDNIIGVERLDYSKGLPDRLRAFRRLLQKHRARYDKKVTLMQIAPPTRESVEAYAEIREELEKLSGAINGEFADFD